VTLPYLRLRDGTRVEIPCGSKERPGLRRAIIRHCKGRGITVTELARDMRARRWGYSPGWRAQIRRMAWEEHLASAPGHHPSAPE
jgi:hypothetical protein